MKVFNPLHHPECFAPVQRLSPSTWTGHLPFAMFLVSILKPRVIVELGTYYGTSYCAFCQTVKELKLDARCYAVDTWEGDPQSGFYGQEVLNDLKRYHDPLYSDFSRLVQSTFDEAADHFTGKTIDLLHIDGFHTYEAVKKDFATWLPKLSERAVTLFHDVNVREKDFGVWKFWEEIRLEFPHFEFAHSHGLGVLAVGGDCPKDFLEFLKYAESNRVEIANFFQQQGQRLENLQELQILRQAISKQQEIINNLQESVSLFQKREQQILVHEESREDLETREKRLKEEALELQDKAAELREKERSLAELNEKLIVKSQRIYGKDWELQTALAKLKNSESKDREASPALNGDGERSEAAVSKLICGVVTFNNTHEQIAQLLKSVEIAVGNLSGLPVEAEIFVIDNGRETFWNESDSLRIVRLASEGNIGFGNAMNRLMKTAFADSSVRWFLCLNPDGQLHRDALRELLLMSGDNPRALIEARQFPEEHNKEYDAETLETPWSSGACLLICRDVYQEIGGFDSNFFMYLEDVDFSWRARTAGFAVKIAPRAIFGHSVLNREFNANADKNMLLSGRYLASKWQNLEFVRWAENELVARQYYPSVEELPELPEVGESRDDFDPRISNFEHYFSFSTPRW